MPLSAGWINPVPGTSTASVASTTGSGATVTPTGGSTETTTE